MEGKFTWRAQPATRGSAATVERVDGLAPDFADIVQHVSMALASCPDWHLEIAPTFDYACVAYGAPPNALVTPDPCPACDVDCEIARTTFVDGNEFARAWTDATGRPMLIVTPVRHITTPSALSSDELAAIGSLIDRVTAGKRLESIKLNVGGYRHWPHLHFKLLLDFIPADSLCIEGSDP